MKIDVFSCGCMLFMMLAGFPAFTAPTRTDSGFKQAVYKSDVQGLLQKFGVDPLPDEVKEGVAAARVSLLFLVLEVRALQRVADEAR